MSQKQLLSVSLVVLLIITAIAFLIAPNHAQASGWTVEYSPADCETVTITGPFDTHGYSVHVSILDWYSGQWLYTQDFPNGYFATGNSFILGRVGTHPFLNVYVYGWSTDHAVPVVWYIYHQKVQCVSSPL